MIDEDFTDDYSLERSKVTSDFTMARQQLVSGYNSVANEHDRTNGIIKVREIYRRADQPKKHTHGSVVYEALCKYAFPENEEEINGQINSCAYFILGKLSTTIPVINIQKNYYPSEYLANKIDIIFERLKSQVLDVINGSLMIIKYFISSRKPQHDEIVQYIIGSGLIEILYKLPGTSYAPLVFEALSKRQIYNPLQDDGRNEILPLYFEQFLENDYPKCINISMNFLNDLECSDIIINHASYTLKLNLARIGAQSAIKITLKHLLMVDGVEEDILPDLINLVRSTKSGIIAKGALSLLWRAWCNLSDEDRSDISSLLMYCVEEAPVSVGSAAVRFLVLSLSPSSLDIRQLAAFVKFIDDTNESVVKNALAGIQAFLCGAQGTEIEEEATAIVEEAIPSLEGLCGSSNEKVSEAAIAICEIVA